MTLSIGILKIWSFFHIYENLLDSLTRQELKFMSKKKKKMSVAYKIQTAYLHFNRKKKCFFCRWIWDCTLFSQAESCGTFHFFIILENQHFISVQFHQLVFRTLIFVMFNIFTGISSRVGYSRRLGFTWWWHLSTYFLCNLLS